jgi:protein-L-isoaspartate(D-aspartate) O-methyltransferase
MKNNTDKLRKNMVKTQIKSRGISDERVLHAMLTVERHKFATGHAIPLTYEDNPLPIGYNQTISQPYIVALMSELCSLNGEEKVLEIGTGSGYQTAVLSMLAKKIYSIEIVEALGISSVKCLKEIGYKNIELKIDDGYTGWIEAAPFDVIILTAAPSKIPEELTKQLADKGKLIAPVGDDLQKLIVVEKNNNVITQNFITFVRFVPMVHK